MKNFTTLFTIIFLATAVSVSANDDVKIYKGSVVLANGETLNGQIEMLSPTLNEVKVKFIDANGNAVIFKAKEVESYQFIFPKYNAETKSYDEEIIEYVKKPVTVAPVPFGPKEVLVERQAKGTINLYNFYVETRESAHAFEHSFLVEKNGQMIEVNRENFKELIKELVADYPELKMRVGTKGYGYRNIASIIREYNGEISTKSPMLGMSDAPF
jgi:hypothetical protein